MILKIKLKMLFSGNKRIVMVIGLIKLYFLVIMEGGITVYYKQQMVELVGIST